MKSYFTVVLLTLALCGLSAAATCHGDPGDCHNIASAFDCNSLDGCNWYSAMDMCTGVATKCDVYKAEATCGMQGDCYWDTGSSSGGLSSPVSWGGILFFLVLVCCIVPLLVTFAVVGFGIIGGGAGFGFYIFYKNKYATAQPADGVYSEL